jgi:predicted NBD/HSP70 family sugar kinase
MTYFSIDIGATNTRITSIKDLDRIIIDKVIKFKTSPFFETEFAQICEYILDLAFDKRIEAISVGFPGSLSRDGKSMESLTNLPNWNNIPLQEILSKKFNCPIFIENDGLIASLGEAHFGENNGENFLYITWGTGIGGSLVMHNKTRIESKRPPWKDYFKNFEFDCGGRKIHERFQKHIYEFNHEEWENLLNKLTEHIIDVSQKLNTNKIVLGGGVSAKYTEKIQEIIPILKKNNIDLSLSKLGDDAGLYGGFVLMRQNA